MCFFRIRFFKTDLRHFHCWTFSPKKPTGKVFRFLILRWFCFPNKNFSYFFLSNFCRDFFNGFRENTGRIRIYIIFFSSNPADWSDRRRKPVCESGMERGRMRKRLVLLRGIVEYSGGSTSRLGHIRSFKATLQLCKLSTIFKSYLYHAATLRRNNHRPSLVTKRWHTWLEIILAQIGTREKPSCINTNFNNKLIS